MLALRLGLAVAVSVYAHGATGHGRRDGLALVADVQQVLVHDVSAVELLESVAESLVKHLDSSSCGFNKFYVARLPFADTTASSRLTSLSFTEYI